MRTLEQMLPLHGALTLGQRGSTVQYSHSLN
jgi:hypothetical protein